jgi:hypothetical protein
MAKCLVITGTSGEILTDDSKVADAIDAALKIAENKLNALGFDWRRLYYWPGDDLYIIIKANDAPKVDDFITSVLETTGSYMLHNKQSVEDYFIKIRKKGVEIGVIMLRNRVGE